MTVWGGDEISYRITCNKSLLSLFTNRVHNKLKYGVIKINVTNQIFTFQCTILKTPCCTNSLAKFDNWLIPTPCFSSTKNNADYICIPKRFMMTSFRRFTFQWVQTNLAFKIRFVPVMHE